MSVPAESDARFLLELLLRGRTPESLMGYPAAPSLRHFKGVASELRRVAEHMTKAIELEAARKRRLTNASDLQTLGGCPRIECGSRANGEPQLETGHEKPEPCRSPEGGQ